MSASLAPNPFHGLAVALLSSLLLAGCLANPLERPTTPAVAAESGCATDCERMRGQCEQRQHLREQLCQEHAARMPSGSVECRDTADHLCAQANVCLGADLGLCVTQHQECLARCVDQAAMQTAPEPSAPQAPPESAPR